MSQIGLVHHRCGTVLTAEQRQIVTRPGDEGWPKDQHVRAPYCEQCRCVVPLDEIRPTVPLRELKR